MQFLAIVVLCVLAAVTYGILHDQVTVRVCIEYFTIGHPPVFATTSPTLLALGWGVIATWWVGLPLGVVLATAARVGSRRKLTATDLLRPLSVLLLVMALLALASGVLGWVLASRGDVSLPEPLFSRVPVEAHVGFLADAFAHLTSYVAGAIGGLVLAVWAWRRRSASHAA